LGIEGWQLNLSTGTYQTPSVCSSCLGPREVEVKAVVSEKAGNIRTTLTMGFPYCTPCSKRAEAEKRWTGLVMIAACVLGGALAMGAWVEDRALYPGIGFPAAILIAAGLSAALAFATRPGAPPPPATARGQAVILRSTDGAVLCTNQVFAERLAQANNASLTPATMWFTTEAWAPLGAMLIGTLVLLMWWKYAPPLPASPSSPPAAASPAARRPAPPPARTPTPKPPGR
jgi:hypothetical protein